MGAYDFFYKPIDAELLGFIVNRAYRLREIEEENLRLHVTGGDSPLEGIITGSPEMQKAAPGGLLRLQRVRPVRLILFL